jgi:hypothetical protein
MATRFSVEFINDDSDRNDEVENRNKPDSIPREQAEAEPTNLGYDKTKTLYENEVKNAKIRLDRKELLAEAKRLNIEGRTRMSNDKLISTIASKKNNVYEEAKKIETRPVVPPEDKKNYRKYLLAEAKDLNIYNRTRIANEDLLKAIEAAKVKAEIDAKLAEINKGRKTFAEQANELADKFKSNPDSMTKRELIDFAMNEGIKNISSLSKPRIIRQLKTELGDVEPKTFSESPESEISDDADISFDTDELEKQLETSNETIIVNSEPEVPDEVPDVKAETIENSIKPKNKKKSWEKLTETSEGNALSFLNDLEASMFTSSEAVTENLENSKESDKPDTKIENSIKPKRSKPITFNDALAEGQLETWKRDSAVNPREDIIVSYKNKRFDLKTKKPVTVKELKAQGFENSTAKLKKDMAGFKALTDLIPKTESSEPNTSIKEPKKVIEVSSESPKTEKQKLEKIDENRERRLEAAKKKLSAWNEKQETIKDNKKSLESFATVSTSTNFDTQVDQENPSPSETLPEGKVNFIFAENTSDKPETVSKQKDEDLFTYEGAGGVAPVIEDIKENLFNYEGSGGEPPKIPPKNTSAGYPEDDDDDSIPEIPPGIEIDINNPKLTKALLEKAERKEKQNELRRIKMEITAAKRRADKQNTINAKREKITRRLQKNAVTESAKIQKRQLKQENDRGDSDRLIRRLTTFGIGRAANIDGGLITALAELMIFQPEIASSDDKMQSELKNIETDLNKYLDSFEVAKTETSVNRDKQSLEIAEIVDAARLALAEGETVDPKDVESALQAVLARNVEIEPSEPYVDSGASQGPNSGPGNVPPNTVDASGWSNTSSGGSGGGNNSGGGSGNSGGSGNPPNTGGPNWTYPSGGQGPNNNRGLIPYNSPATTSGATNVNQTGTTFVSAMARSTSAMLGAYIGLTSLKEASDLLSDSFDKIGEVLTTPETITPITELAGDAGKVAGMGAGAAIGSTFGPVGTVAGAIVGKAISSAIIEPLVSLIQAAETIVGSAAKDSVGPNTIIAKVEAQVDLLEQRLRNSFRVDDETAEYVSVSNDFAKAINDLKTTLVPLITPILSYVTQGFTVAVQIFELIAILVNAVPFVKQMKDLLSIQNLINQKGIEGIEALLDWFRSSSRSTTNNNIIQGITDFFGGNNAFATSGSMNNNIHRNTPAGRKPDIHTNLLSF